jgi:hypothetical protein
MNSLQLRKQYLIAESELNRVRLVQESQPLVAAVHALAQRARSASLLATVAVSLVAGLVCYRRNQAAPAAGNNSGWRKIWSGAQWLVSLWAQLRPPGAGT